MARNIIFIVASLFLASSVWVWVQNITIAHQESEARERGIPRGNLSDLYPRWLGTRELVLHQRDPYSDEITREIQTGYYGRPIDSTRPNDPKDQQAFAYPVYVVLLLAPTVTLPFTVVQKTFLLLLAVLTVTSILLWFGTLKWQVTPTAKLVWIILVMGCFPAIQGLKLQQLTLLVAAFLAAAMYSLVHRRFVLAGILLAVASIKPQLVLLIAIWLIVWVFGNWRERQRLFWSAAASLAILVGAGEFLLPGWIHEFRAASSAYYRYTGGGRSLLDVALTPIAGRIVAAVIVSALTLVLWRVRAESEASVSFQWSIAVVFATTLLVIPMFAPYNQVLLVPCVMLIAKNWRDLWNENRISRFLLVFVVSSIAWPWIASTALALALLVLPATSVQRAWPIPLGTTLMIPVLLTALIFASRKAICFGTARPQ